MDTSRQLMGRESFLALLRAIENNELTEDEFLEWKNLDIAGKEGCFPIARAILGFANRDPDVGERRFEGRAYIVVGMTPVDCQGVTVVDPADLGARIDPYVKGEKGPGWAANYCDHEGVHVLVVEVDRPRWGDPIWPLRKQGPPKKGEPVQQGTAFVRWKGRTRPATDTDIDMLSRRAAAAGTAQATPFDVSCTLSPDGPLRTFDTTAFVEDAVRRARRHVDQLVEQANARMAEDSKPFDPLSEDGQRFLGQITNFAAFANPLGLPRPTPDNRTFSEFIAETEAFVDDVRAWSGEAWKREAWHNSGDLHLTLRNLTDSFATNVRTTLKFDDGRVLCLDEEPEEVLAPESPRPLGEPTPVDHSYLTGWSPTFHAHHLVDSIMPYTPADAWVRNDGAIIFDVEHLRQRGQAVSDPFRIIVPVEVTGPLVATGHVTAQTPDRVVDIELPIDLEDGAQSA